MRFLLFNIVVFGALFYLFTADKTDIRAATDNAHAVVSRAETLANQTVDRVNTLIGKAEPEVHAFASEPKQAEATPQAVVPVVPAIPEKAVAQEPTPAIQAPPPAPETKDSERPINSPTRLVANEIPAHWVPERAAPTVDPAVTKKLLAASDPGAPQAAESHARMPTNAVAGGKPEIAIAKGETLMSPRERRKELAALAEDMELLSLKKLNR